MKSNGTRMGQFIQFSVSMVVVNKFELFRVEGNLNSWPKNSLFALIHIADVI